MEGEGGGAVMEVGRRGAVEEGGKEGKQWRKWERWRGREWCEGMEGEGAKAHSPELIITHVHSQVLAIIRGHSFLSRGICFHS